MLRSNLGENEKSFQEFSTSSFNNVNKIILQYDRNWTRNGPNTNTTFSTYQQNHNNN